MVLASANTLAVEVSLSQGTHILIGGVMEVLLLTLMILFAAACMPHIESQSHCGGYCNAHGCYCNFRAGHEGDCSHFCSSGSHWF